LLHSRDSLTSAADKIFIAAAFSQNEGVLPYWTATMLSVIAYRGPSNIFVSIVESHSSDASPVLLTALADTLAARGVQHRILVRDDDAIEKPEDLSFNNRINFLAAIRNRVLEPLIKNGGYDRVLFSNDVFVEPESVIELLEINGGEYDVACAMDFNHFGAYDAWVLRDRLGHLTGTIWPYFIDAPSIKLMREDSPVPAFACWNGMIVFSAYPPSLRTIVASEALMLARSAAFLIEYAFDQVTANTMASDIMAQVRVEIESVNVTQRHDEPDVQTGPSLVTYTHASEQNKCD